MQFSGFDDQIRNRFAAVDIHLLLQRYDYLEKSMERLFHRYVVAAFEQPAPVVAEASTVSKRAYSHFSRVSKAQPVAARCF
mgnify:FL=1